MEKTLFFCSRSVPFTLQMIHFRSALELALSFKQLGLAQTQHLSPNGGGRGDASVHQQGPKRYSMFAARKGFLISIVDCLDYIIKIFSKNLKPRRLLHQPDVEEVIWAGYRTGLVLLRELVRG